jgi:hypothetical protein
VKRKVTNAVSAESIGSVDRGKERKTASSESSSPAEAKMIGFLVYFKDLHDPRQQGKLDDPPEEILRLCLTATLAGAEHHRDRAVRGDEARAAAPVRQRHFTS